VTAIRREAQRLFVSPADGALARLRRMCDTRFAGVNPAAAKIVARGVRSNFLIVFFFIVFRSIMINKTFDHMGKVTAAVPAR
jgi:hypothetical protein